MASLRSFSSAMTTKGRQIFETISADLTEGYRGRLVVIAVDSGEHFIGETGIAATRKAQATYPGQFFFLGRIGYRTAYTFTGRR